MISKAKLGELRKRGHDPLGIILTYQDGKRVLDTLEAALKVVEAAKADHRFRMGDSFMNGADCKLCEALKPFEAETEESTKG